MMLPVLVAAMVALSTSAVLVPTSVRIARRKKLLDIPNLRSSHTVPTPRIGGVGIVIGTFCAVAVASIFFEVRISGELFGFCCVFALGALVGFGDDVFQLKIGIRMLLYLALAVGAARLGASVRIPLFSEETMPFVGTAAGMIFSVLFLVWYTNLFNFMDGINGIAASTAVVTMGAFTVLFARSGFVAESIFAVSAAASSLGFLFFNFPKARVFMGDGGAVFIGMAAGVLSLHAVHRELISLHGAVLLMYPFVFDATFTLVRRMICREKFWQAHRTHLYQQLCDLGWRHTRITAVYFLAATACAVLGLSYRQLAAPIRLAAVLCILMLSFGVAFVVLRCNRPPKSVNIR